MSTQHQLVGTPAYMSPEQARGQRSDPRSDVYSLGVMLYEMISGRQAFAGNLDEVICAVLTQEPARPRRLDRSIPRDLELICLKAIAKQPADRYQTAAEMADDLSCYLRGEPIHSRRYRSAVLVWRGVRRKAIALGSAVVLCLVAIALAAVVLHRGGPPQRGVSVVSTETRSVHLKTVPATGKVIFVPLSPIDGEPIPVSGKEATGQGEVEISVTPGDYWVEVLWPDGRFHDVFRHVPYRGEKSFGSENHLRWTVTADGTVEVPDIEVPRADIAESLMLIDRQEELAVDDSKNDQLPKLEPFYIAQKLSPVSEFLHLNPTLPAYLSQLAPNQINQFHWSMITPLHLRNKSECVFQESPNGTARTTCFSYQRPVA